jgi:hypothetical protein
MHKDYLEFIDAYYYLIIVDYFVNYLEFQKSKIICYQSVWINRIDSIALSRSCERSLES